MKFLRTNFFLIFAKNSLKSFKDFGFWCLQSGLKPAHMRTVTHKMCMKSRIVALALIVIVLSSSSFSAVDGYSVSFTIKDVKEFTHKLNGNNYQITLVDAVAASIVNKKMPIINEIVVMSQ